MNKATPTTSQSQPLTDRQLYRRLLTYLAPYKKRFIIGLLATLPSAGISGAAVLLIGELIDELIKSQNYDLLMWVPVALLVFSGLGSLFSYISTYNTSYVGTAITQDLRKALYNKLCRRDLKYLSTNSVGELQSRYYNDPTNLQLAIVSNLQTMVMQGATALVLAGVLLYKSWQFALLAIGVISLVVVPITIISKKLRALDNVSQKVSARMFNVFHESVIGARVIAIFDLYRHQAKRFRESNQEYFGNAMSLIKATALLKPATQIVSALGIGAILWFGTYRVQQGELSPGELTSFLVALVMLYKPIKEVASIVSKTQRVLAPAQRVFTKLDMPPSMQEPDNPVVIERFESIVFNDVDFGYHDDQLVLHNIDLTVKRGEILAIVGESGGGKSTLVDLIPRFMDVTRGKILVNGIDVKEVSLANLRQFMSVVSQDTLLFDGTLLDNIKLGKLNATDGEINQVIKTAYLQPVIDTLPEGLNTIIGANGALLSGGQKQRIAIARALLKNAELIILDEATSALDNESEAAVHQGMAQLTAGKTVIVIAHRLSTVRSANRILVLDKGRIRECGSHDELMANNGFYKRLYTLQFRHQEAAGTDNPTLLQAKAG